MRRYLLFFLFLLILSNAVSAATKIANDPTRVGVGARPLGMGKAFAGIANDPNAIYLNPAGIAGINRWEFSSMSGRFINEVDYLEVGMVFPSEWGSFGIGYCGSAIGFTAQIPTFEVVDGVIIIPSSSEGVHYGYSNYAVSLTYGSELTRFSDKINFLKGIEYFKNADVGGTLKIYSQTLSGTGINGSATGADIDLAALYKFSPSTRLALNLQNTLPASLGGKIVWTTGAEETYPLNTKVGFAGDIVGQTGWVENESQRLTMALDGDFALLRKNIPTLWHLGLEYSPSAFLEARIGVDQETIGGSGDRLEVANNMTYGVGLFFGGFRFDYAYHDYFGLTENTTSYFSLSYIGKDEERKKEEREVIEIVSPRDKSVLYDEDIKIVGHLTDKKATRLLLDGKDLLLTVDGLFEQSARLALSKNAFNFSALNKDNRIFANKLLRILRLAQFLDIDNDYWAKLSIEQWATLGVITGYPDGTFRPLGTITRAELTTLLAKLKSITMKPKEPTFKDVKENHWAYSYIEAAVDAGLVTGYPDGTFRPNRPISRAEGVAIIARFAELTEPKVIEPPFSDIAGRHWAVKEITAAKIAGMLDYIKEEEGFDPNRDLSRGESAAILAKTPFGQKKINELMDFEAGYEK